MSDDDWLRFEVARRLSVGDDLSAIQLIDQKIKTLEVTELVPGCYQIELGGVRFLAERTTTTPLYYRNQRGHHAKPMARKDFWAELQNLMEG